MFYRQRDASSHYVFVVAFVTGTGAIVGTTGLAGIATAVGAGTFTGGVVGAGAFTGAVVGAGAEMAAFVGMTVVLLVCAAGRMGAVVAWLTLPGARSGLTRNLFGHAW